MLQYSLDVSTEHSTIKLINMETMKTATQNLQNVRVIRREILLLYTHFYQETRVEYHILVYNVYSRRHHGKFQKFFDCDKPRMVFQMEFPSNH